MSHRRIIGLDYGSKRVGLAVSDPLRMFSQPMGAYPPDKVMSVVDQLIAEDGVEQIIIGWPELPDATEGEAVDRVRSFVKRLQKRYPDIDIIPWNEEYTSELAKELIRSGSSPSLRRSGRGRIDAAAAAVILQEYLDSQAPVT